MIQPLNLLPPDLFPPDIQPLIYFTIMPAIIIFGIVFLIFFWILIIPPEAKTYIKNRIWKKDMFDVETESGVRILDTGKIHPEGIAVLDKTKLILPIPRPIPNQQIQMAMTSMGIEQNEINTIIKQVQEAERITLKPSIVKGLGCRMYRVFQSTALATTLATLVGLTHDGNSKSALMAIPVLAKNGKRIEPAKLLIKQGEKLTELTQWIVKVALLVDPNIIRTFFNPQFSPSQADAIEHLGELKERARSGSILKKWMLPIILIVIIVIIAISAVVLLGGGGGSPQPTP